MQGSKGSEDTHVCIESIKGVTETVYLSSLCISFLSSGRIILLKKYYTEHSQPQEKN